MSELTRDASINASNHDVAKFGKTLSLWIRRCHLHLGLFFAPWAMLYGITGYLFNHPTHFSDRGLKEISPATLAQCGFDGQLPDPQAAAREVISQLNERFPNVKLELASNSEPKYVGDFFFATANGTDKTFQLLIRRDGGGGTYLDSTPAPQAIEKKAEFTINPRVNNFAGAGGGSVPPVTTPTESLRITNGVASIVESILPELATRLELPGLDKPFQLTSAPQLQFRAQSQGDIWEVTYDSFKGSVNARFIDPLEKQKETSWRSYLLRLHTTHGYTGKWETRWVWAVMVDAIASLLIFWAVSGFIMWWQIKRLRTLGIVVIALSIAVAGAMFLNMARVLQDGGL